MIRALLCRFGLHRMPTGVSSEWSIYWCCARCGARVDGKIGGRR